MARLLRLRVLFRFCVFSAVSDRAFAISSSRCGRAKTACMHELVVHVLRSLLQIVATCATVNLSIVDLGSLWFWNSSAKANLASWQCHAIRRRTLAWDVRGCIGGEVKRINRVRASKSLGYGVIRTHASFTRSGFESDALDQLGHASVLLVMKPQKRELSRKSRLK